METPSNNLLKTEVRRAFVRHWIDVDQLHFHIRRDTVRIGGEIRMTSSQHRRIDAAFFDALEAEIRRIPDVKRVQFDLWNWKRDAGGRWVCLEGGVRDRGRAATGRRDEDEASRANEAKRDLESEPGGGPSHPL